MSLPRELPAPGDEPCPALTSSLLSLPTPASVGKEMSRSCHNLPVTGGRREETPTDAISVKDWRRRHKTRGFRDKKGFPWRRHGTPDEIPHQRSPKLKLRVEETFANDLSNGECLRPALLQDISSQSLPLIEASTIQQDRESLDKSLTSVSVSSNKIETDDDILHNDNGIIVNRYQHVNLQ